MAKVALEELLAGLVRGWKSRAMGLRRGGDWSGGGYAAGWVQGYAAGYLGCAEQLERILPRDVVELQQRSEEGVGGESGA